MTQFLPSNLLALFAPREPLKYLPPASKLPCEKNYPPYTGIAAFLNNFECAKDVPPPTRVETKDEKKERQKKERAEQIAYKLEQDLAMWDPSSDARISGDPFKTLFCSRINYDTSESKLRREFDVYGPVKKVTMIYNTVNGKPRGYAFVEFESERDMHAAYKHADGKKIDGRRVLVDVERGRTVKGWQPRRLGGGLGNTRKGGPDVNTRYSGREDFVGRDRDVPDGRNGLESRDGRDRSTDRRRPSRSRSRDRAGIRRRSRSPRERRRRSRERRRTPDRADVKKEPVDEVAVKTEPGMEDDKEAVRAATKRRRSRSPRPADRDRSDRDRSDRDRRRSRSRDRKRNRRSRSRDRRAGSKSRSDRPSRKEGGGGEQPVIKKELDNMGDYAEAGGAAGPNDGSNGGGAVGAEGPYSKLEDL